MSEKKIEKKSFDFATYWQRFGTISILLLLLIVLAIAKPTAVFSSSSVPQILRQSAVNILLALGGLYALILLVLGLDIGVEELESLGRYTAFGGFLMLVVTMLLYDRVLANLEILYERRIREKLKGFFGSI